MVPAPNNRRERSPSGMVLQVYSAEKTRHHAELLANRVRKQFRHLAKRFRKQGIECFRLYDWDIPEVRAVVDWYAGHLVIAEYERTQTGTDWLPKVAAAAAEALNVPPARLHVKHRRTRSAQGPRYPTGKKGGEWFEVRERDLRFRVNLSDYLDTGLYSDHRETRVLVRQMAKETDFLNLYAYTGAFTCAAAAGGASSTISVDRSATYLKWARENLVLNDLAGPRHNQARSDVDTFLDKMMKQGRKFSLAFVDPPSFFQDQSSRVSFDIVRDHPGLLRKVIHVMSSGSVILFSTNHQRFEPHFEGLPVKELREITPGTIPEDYRNRRVHRCWEIRV